MFDIYVNFMSALEYQDGSKETNMKILAKNYTRSWFAFDLISVIPFQLIENFFPKPPELDFAAEESAVDG